MDYKDLQRVNSEIKTTDIKGKNYAEVPQRITAFRKLYPTGFIKTELLSNVDKVCVIRAEVGYHDDASGADVILGTGMAYEKEDSTFINKTSYIENCETSAVGRALGMCGFGIDTSVASAEEVQTAILNQAASEAIGETRGNALRKHLIENEIAPDFVCKGYKVRELKELTEAQHAQIVKNIKKIKESYDKEAAK